MSTLETNSIAKYSGNNVSIDDSLNLKSYTTTQRDALTSAAGDMIYNSTTTKVEYYTGSEWIETGGVDAFSLEYLIVAGGGGGASGKNNSSVATTNSGGGGAGGLLSNVSGDNTGGGVSAQPAYYALTGINYRIKVGAGGAKGDGAYNTSPSSEESGQPGTRSAFHEFKSRGGGGGAGRNYNFISGNSIDDRAFSYGTYGGSGGGMHASVSNNAEEQQGYDGGIGNSSNNNAGGGGGAGGAGVSFASGAAGGIGAITTILTTSEATTASVGEVSGSDLYFAGGGGGGGNTTNNGGPAGGTGGGGKGSRTFSDDAVAGTANTGGGGGGGASRSDGSGWDGENGGSGVVILRYPNTKTITVGAGLTSSTITQGTNKVTIFTAGIGTVSFS
jgi:hypothetical protein